jgi:outer membrane protein OmpA-like peptidoglycan-associated protein
MTRQATILSGLVLLAALAASPAHAQEDERGFSLNLLQTAQGNGAFLTVDGADVPSGFSYFVGGMFDYQYRPVVIRTCREQADGGCSDWGGVQAALVEHHLSFEMGGGISLFRILEAGVVLPLVLYQAGEGVEDGTGSSVSDIAGRAGLDDLRLHLKLDLWHGVFRQKGDTIGLALVPVLTLPTGRTIHHDSFMGDSLVTVHTKLVFNLNVGRVRMGLSAGYMWREVKDFYLADMGHRLSYGAALEVKISSPLYGLVEIFGQNGFTSEVSSSPLELDAGVRFRFGSGIVLTAGAGAGLLAGVGTPAFRIFAGLGFSPPRVGEPVDEDRDGDGILNIHDECPDDPEDRDGFDDDDGCPDPDNDGDGFLDADDECPDDAEDEDGFEDDDGCPDEDDDGDGIPDARDECPDKPEDEDGFEDKDGCPDEDNDGDGILDVDDECPDKPEDEDGFEDDDGCPDKDNDVDGIPDEQDQCPTEKEVFNDFEDEDGCPDEGEAILTVEKGQIVLLQKIHFATDSDKIVKKKSFLAMDTVIKILKANPDMKVRIEGHTDDQGSMAHNMDLSERRAESVKKYLVENGIDGDRLETVGYGPKKPIADNKTKKGRAKNRRVEFHITQE